MHGQSQKIWNPLTLTFSIALIIIALAVAYYLVIFLPNKERNDNNETRSSQILEATEKSANKTKLDECLNDVNQRFSASLKDNPKLSSEDAKIFLDFVQKQRDECYKKYPVQ
ncbi:MAG: hypothetical protein PHE56_13975 [Bacteroidales bacterium]|nr:hypothetical protein [Bacteroidales bacterium]